ncbi:unnamed protein product [Phaedon cochleariae]|uniref:Lysosomal Pro-X carboxypeptidase n=1 Tax=Phaedon cochleariae TaxID=80249 RepID=A0A9N9SEQ7_PHACE|nr:unnamed protein product [Phaedon cochleariae]
MMRLPVILICFSTVIFAEEFEYLYSTKYIDVPLDHFNFRSNATFKLRYLINDTYHVQRGPIFFYTGNEGDINQFAQNTGFMYDIASTFNALLVFAEHRYYGTSLPFGNLSYTTPEYLGYLSSAQALADFAYLIDDLQSTYAATSDLKKVPVIAFGGSYGGMLAAYLRMKYPYAVAGAVASSAPIWQFRGLTPCENFNRIVTNVYEALGGVKCKDTIAKSWKIIRSLTETDEGKSNLTKLWNFCTPLKTSDDIDTLVDWLTNIYVNVAMVNYPYPTSFLADLPAYPVRAVCSKINNFDYKNDFGLLQALGEALSVYTNYTGRTTCNDIKVAANIGEKGWGFQSCTDMIMPMCSTSFDMFEDAPWDFEKYSDDCYKKFSVRPRNEQVPLLEYGGKDIKSASDIVFSNGLMDPWSSGGVLSNVSDRISAVIIPDAAHHFDLRGANANDPGSVREARRFHVKRIHKWLNKFYFENLDDPLKYKFYETNRV